MLPWSVMPIAGWPSAAAAATSVADPGGAVEHRVLGVDVQVGERSHSCSLRTAVSTLRSHRRPSRPGHHGGDEPAGRGHVPSGHARSRPRTGLTPGAELAAGRICSSCWRAAICWANSVAWMPWNRPSSQPTSWAWAMRSSDSLGVPSSSNGRAERLELVPQVGRQRSASSSTDVS